MIKDLDETLKLLLEQSLQRVFSEPVTIFFDPPLDDNKPSGNYAVDLFLYDVRENRDLRGNEWQIDRNGASGVAKRQPRIRVDCSYLITAWSQTATGEHDLLGQVMKVLLRHPVLPDAILQGELKGQKPPLPAAVLQPGRLQSLGEFWQALGGKPKAALNYTVTIGVEAGEPIELGPPVTDKRVPSDPTETTP